MIDPTAAAGAAIRLSAVTDQFIEAQRPIMKAVAEYHAACVVAGLPERVADEMALRFAARVVPLPPRGADYCWDSTL